MSTPQTRRIQQITTDNLSYLNNGQIGLSVSADSVTGKESWGGKDLDGDVHVFLEKDQNARVLGLSASTIQSTGNVNATGFTIGGVPHTHAISALDGVSTNTPLNGQVLKYVTSAGEYVPSTITVSGGSGYIPGGADRIIVSDIYGTDLTDSGNFMYKNSAITMTNGSKTVNVGPLSTVDGGLGISGVAGNSTDIYLTPYSGPANQHSAGLHLTDKAGLVGAVVETAKYQMVRTDTVAGQYTSQHEWYTTSANGSLSKVATLGQDLSVNNMIHTSGGIRLGYTGYTGASPVISGIGPEFLMTDGWGNSLLTQSNRLRYEQGINDYFFVSPTTGVMELANSANGTLFTYANGAFYTQLSGYGTSTFGVNGAFIPAGKAYYIGDSPHTHTVDTISATGTKTSATYLAGNGTWSIPNVIAHTQAITTISGTANRIPYFDGSGNGATTSALSWDSVNNNLGIGISAASNKLHVVTTDTSNEVIYGQMTGLSANPSAYSTSQGTLSLPAGSMIGAHVQPLFASDVDIFSGFTMGVRAAYAYIGALKTQNTTSAANSADIVFGRRTGASAHAESMRISYDGKVGIGTSTPSFKLDIKASIATTENIFAIRNNASQQIHAFGKSAETAIYSAYNSSAVETIRLFAGGDSWISGGKLGIGADITNPPSYDLHVSKTVNRGGVTIETKNASTDSYALISSRAGDVTTTLESWGGTWSTGGGWFGLTRQRYSALLAANAPLAIGTTQNYSITIGTNNLPAMTIGTDQSVTFGGTKYPTAVGTVGQVLTYSSAGVATWSDKTDETGSFTGTWTGMATTVTGTIYWQKIGDVVSLIMPFVYGTSNTVSFTITGVPVAIHPASQQYTNGTSINLGVSRISFVTISTSGVMEFTNGTTDGGGSGGYSTSGFKGTHKHVISYHLL